MKSNLLLTMLLFVSCTSSIEYYNYDFAYDKIRLGNPRVVICPVTGYWVANQSDSIHMRLPEVEEYVRIFARQLPKVRSCAVVIGAAEANRLVPEFEVMMYAHRYAFQNMTGLDSSAFKFIGNKTNGDFLVYFEKVESSRYRTTVGYAPAEHKTASVLFQIWDLKSLKLVCRAYSSGEGTAYAGFFKKQSSNEALVNLAREVANNLPKCR